MSKILGDGGIRRAPEPGPAPPADIVARGPEEIARLLVGAPRFSAEIRERISEAYPEGSERRRRLGAALVSMEGGEPGALAASVLEARVTKALARLDNPPDAHSPGHLVSSDTLEAARDFGRFGGPASLLTTPPSSGGPVSSAGVYTIAELASGPPSERGLRPSASLGAAPAEVGQVATEAWQPSVTRAQEMAPGIVGGLVSLGKAEHAVASVRRGLAGIGEEQGLWARARKAAGEDALGRIAARFEGLRQRVDSGLEAAAPRPGVARAETLGAVARELRGEAAGVRQDIGWARELVRDVGLPHGGSAHGELARAEGEMGAADYALQAFAAQQEIVSDQEAPAQIPASPESAEAASAPASGETPLALTPEMITPEVIEHLRASGQVPSEVIAQLEAGDITPELLAQLQGQSGARIRRAELESIGTEIAPPPAQGFWNIGTVGAGMDRAIFDGNDYSQKAAEATNRTLRDATAVRPIDGAELAAAIRDMGVPLSKVDPSQLQSAVDYINNGSAGAVAEFGQGAPKTADEQRERMALALRQTRYLVEHGAAPIDRQTAINLCWSAARIPGHAFEGMSDEEARAVAQQTAAACNTPGNHEFKVGKHTVKLTIGESGTVDSTSTKPPSAWGRIGRIANVVLTVASFMPPPVGVVARCVQTGIALVNAIRNGGSFLDIVAAGASFVGAGGAAIGGVAGGAARVANAVSGVARGVQGIQRGGVGGVLSGLGAVAGGIAGGMQVAGGSSGAYSVFSTAGRVLGQAGAAVGAAESYIHANRAVGQAREAVQQARASGDPAKIQRAERQLAEAERGKRSAILGGLATAGQVAANTLSRNTQGQTEARTEEVPAEGRSAFQVGAEIFSRGMSAARGINERDFLTVGVEAFGAAAAARQGTKPIEKEDIIHKGERIPVLGPDGKPTFLQRDDFNLLNRASSVLDGLNDWRGAERSERQAREAVGQAKEALERAKTSGDPEVIREAEAELRQARQGLVQADLGSNLALDNAAERFTGALDAFKNSRAADGYRREERGAVEAELEKIKKTLAETREEMTRQRAIVSDPNTDPQARLLAGKRVEQLGQAMSVMGQLLALPGDDPERLRKGREVFIDHRNFVLTANLDTRDLAGTMPSAPGANPGRSGRPSQAAAGIAVLSRNGTLSHIAAMTGVSVERLQEFNARYGIDLSDTTHLPTGQRVLVPMDEVQPRITVPMLSPEQMLARQEHGLPMGFAPRMNIRPGDSEPGDFADSPGQPGFFDEARDFADGVRDLANDGLAELTPSIVNSGQGGPIAFLGTLPLHVLDESVNFTAGFAQGGLNAAEGLTQMVRHPVDTTLGVASLLDRAAQTTPAGRTLEFLAEAAYGKYRNTDEALKAYRERMDQASIGAAQYALVRDLTAAQFEQSIKLAKEGRYSQALGVLYGENLPDVLVGGILGRGNRLTRLVERALPDQQPGKIAPKSSAPAWKQYEQRYGGRQTPMETTFEGRTVKVRLDKPPSDAQVVDFKDFDWSNPSYEKPFIMKRVIEDFTMQIQKYKTIRPSVHLQFSRNPPSWVVDAIRRAGGTYSVAP